MSFLAQKLFSFLLILPLIVAAPSGAATIVLKKERIGSYRLEGQGFRDVAAIDVLIHHDPRTLHIERVIQGGWIQGGLFEKNANSDGRVHIGFVTAKAIQGSGLIARIQGQAGGEGPSRIMSMSARLYDSKGSPMSVNIQLSEIKQPTQHSESFLSDPDLSKKDVSQADEEEYETSNSRDFHQRNSTHSTSNIHRKSQLPQGESSKISKSAENQALSFANEESSGVSEASRKSDAVLTGRSKMEPNSFVSEKKIINLRPVWEKICKSGGNISRKKVQETLEERSKNIYQSPLAAISDGVNQIQVILPKEKETISNFALSGGKIIKDSIDENGYLNLTILPYRNISDVTLSIMNRSFIINYSLVVFPPEHLKTTGNVNTGERCLYRFAKKALSLIQNKKD